MEQMGSKPKRVSVELDVEEIRQLEDVLKRHRRTPLVIGLQEKMLRARRSIEEVVEREHGQV
jgi:hypothetical protein